MVERLVTTLVSTLSYIPGLCFVTDLGHTLANSLQRVLMYFDDWIPVSVSGLCFGDNMLIFCYVAKLSSWKNFFTQKLRHFKLSLNCGCSFDFSNLWIAKLIYTLN